MDPLPREHPDGSWSIMLRSCPTATVAALLDPAVPFVWLPGHWPERVLKWWDVDLPLIAGDAPRRLRVRSLHCELLFDTAEFLRLADRFDGVALYQLARPVPGSLTPGLPHERLLPVLRRFGLAAHFYQPHSMEVASYRTWDRGWMQRVLGNPDVSRLAC